MVIKRNSSTVDDVIFLKVSRVLDKSSNIDVPTYDWFDRTFFKQTRDKRKQPFPPFQRLLTWSWARLFAPTIQGGSSSSIGGGGGVCPLYSVALGALTQLQQGVFVWSSVDLGPSSILPGQELKEGQDGPGGVRGPGGIRRG